MKLSSALHILRKVKLGHKQASVVGMLSFCFFFLKVNVAHALAFVPLIAPTLWTGIVAGGTWLAANFIKATAVTVASLVAVSFVSSVILAVSAQLFDTAITWTVLNISTLLSGNVLLEIQKVWVVSRDIANILIIGVFVYIAISKIIGRAKSFNPMIVSLLTVAILINFSFFFTQVVIDLSNWASVQVYNSISSTDSGVVSLSTKVVSNISGVTELTQLDGGALEKLVSGNVSGAVGFVITSSIMSLLVAILFARMAFMFISRFIILTMLLATSALAFAAMLIPGLQSYWTMWRKALVKNAILAPLLIMLLWAILLIIGAVTQAIPSDWSSSADSIKNLGKNADGLSGAWYRSILEFFITIGLLWAAIRISTDLSNKAAESAGTFGKYVNAGLGKMQGWGAAKVLAGGSILGTYGIGRGLSSMADRAKKNADKSGKVGKTLYGGIANVADKAAKAVNSDMRNSKTATKMFKSAGIDIKDGKKGGMVDRFQNLKTATAHDEKTTKEALARNEEVLAKERSAAGLTQSTKQMEANKAGIDSQIAASNKQSDALQNTMSKMEEHGNKLNTKEGAEEVLQEANERKNELVAGITKAKESGDKGFVARQESQLQQEEAKITSIEKLLGAIKNSSDEEGLINAAYDKDMEANRTSTIQLTDAQKLDRDNTTKVKRDTAISQLKSKHRISDMRTNAQTATKTVNTTMAENISIAVKKYEDEQASLKKKSLKAEADISESTALDSMNNKRIDHIIQGATGITPERTLKEHGALIQAISELEGTIIDLKDKQDNLETERKEAARDLNISKERELAEKLKENEENIEKTTSILQGYRRQKEEASQKNVMRRDKLNLQLQQEDLGSSGNIRSSKEYRSLGTQIGELDKTINKFDKKAKKAKKESRMTETQREALADSKELKGIAQNLKEILKESKDGNKKATSGTESTS